MRCEYLYKDNEQIPEDANKVIGTMPFNGRYELIGFRLQMDGKANRETGVQSSLLVPIWKDHNICRNYVRSKY